jgi:outer membrane lipoprotein-sorting protein
MKTIKNTTFLFLLLLCPLVLLGCSQKSSENKSIDEVKAEAEKMDANQLRSMAMEYKEAIEAKKGEVEKLLAKFKNIPPAEMMDTKAKEITDEINKINRSITALNEKFMIYYNKLKEKGGDTSDLEI